jgi:hypothetical protein
MWLRDFLPNDIPKIRTLIFGYDAALKNSTSTSSIGDYARQLLLAIHSVRADGEGVRYWQLPDLTFFKYIVYFRRTGGL